MASNQFSPKHNETAPKTEKKMLLARSANQNGPRQLSFLAKICSLSSVPFSYFIFFMFMFFFFCISLAALEGFSLSSFPHIQTDRHFGCDRLSVVHLISIYNYKMPRLFPTHAVESQYCDFWWRPIKIAAGQKGDGKETEPSVLAH